MGLMEIRRRILLEPRKICVTWNNFQPPFSTARYKAYNASYIQLTDESVGVVKQTILDRNWNGYNASVRLIATYPSVLMSHIYYISYMVNPSRTMQLGVEAFGGAVFNHGSCPAWQWTRMSFTGNGTRNGYGLAYFGNIRNWVHQNQDYILLKAPLYIDLTAMYGAGNEPDLQTFENQCAKNGIDLTESHEQNDTGTQLWWII